MFGALDDLVDGIYRTAQDQAEWEGVLRQLAAAFRASTAGFVFYSRTCPQSSISTYIGLPQHAAGDYQAHFSTVNEWMRHGLKKLRTGTVHENEELCPRDLMRRSEFYNDWLTRHDIAEALGACVFAERDVFTNLTLMRSERLGPYDRDDVQLLQRVLPHVQCATELHRRLSIAELESNVARSALDALRIAVIAVDSRCRIVFANDRALRLMRLRDGLSSAGRDLIASRSNETERLRRLVAHASAVSMGQGTPAPGALQISRPSMRRSLNVLVSPLSRMQRFDDIRLHMATALLFVSTEDLDADGDERLLRDCFALTRAESTVARRVAGGMAVEEIAHRLRCSPQTIRVHLKHIFRKTAVHSQSELTALLARIPVA